MGRCVEANVRLLDSRTSVSHPPPKPPLLSRTSSRALLSLVSCRSTLPPMPVDFAAALREAAERDPRQKVARLEASCAALEAELARQRQQLALARQKVSALEESARHALWPLPQDAVALIFSFVPVHDRLRCREVCRAWRDCLSDPAHWEQLEFEPPEELSLERQEQLLLAACVRAQSRLSQAAFGTTVSFDERCCVL